MHVNTQLHHDITSPFHKGFMKLLLLVLVLWMDWRRRLLVSLRMDWRRRLLVSLRMDWRRRLLVRMDWRRRLEDGLEEEAAG